VRKGNLLEIKNGQYQNSDQYVAIKVSKKSQVDEFDKGENPYCDATVGQYLSYHPHPNLLHSKSVLEDSSHVFFICSMNIFLIFHRSIS